VDTASSPAIVVPEEPPVSSTVEEVVSSSKTTDEKMTKYDEKAERQGWDLEEYERIKGEIVQLKEMRKKVNDSYLSQSDREYINQRWEHYQELQKNTKGNGLAQFELVFIRARVKALHEYMENESSWNWRWSGKKAVDETDTVKKTAIEQARIDRLHLILKDHTATFTEESWTDSLALYTNEKFNFAAADKDLAASRNALKALLRDKDGFELDQDVVTKISQLFFARKNNKYREGIAPRDDIYPSDGITPDLAISPEPDDDIWTLPAKPDFGTLPTSEDQEETHAILLDLARKLRDRKAAEEKQRLQAKQDQPQPHLPEPAKSEEPTQPPSPEPTTEAIESRNLRDLQCDPIIRVNDRGEQWVVFNKTDGKRHNYLKNGLKKALASAVEEGGSWKLTYENLPTKLELIVAPEQKSKLEETIQNFEAQKGASKLPFIDEILKSSEFKGLFTKTADEIFTGELLALLTEVNADNAQDKRIQLLDALYHHPTVGTEFKNILHSKMRVIQLNAFMDRVYGSESGKDAVVNWNADGTQNKYRRNEPQFDAEWAKVPQLNRAQRLFARMRNVFTNQGVPRAGETTFVESVVGQQDNPSAPEANPDRNKKINRKRAIAAAVVVAALATLSSVTVANKGENDAEKGTTATPSTAVLDAEKLQAAAGKDVDNLTPQEEAIADRLSDDQTEELVPVANSAGKWEATRLSNGDISLISNDSGESVTVHVPQAEESEVQSGLGAIKIGAEPTQAQDRVIDADKIATEVVQDVIDQTKQEQVRANVSEASAETPTMFSTSIWNKLATELPLIKALKNDVVFGAVFQSDLTVEQRNEGNIAGGQLIDVLKDVNNAFLLLSNRDVDLSSVGKGSKLILLTGVTDIKDIITLREKYPDADGAILDKTQNTNLAIYTRLVLQKAARIQAGEASELTDFEKWVVERLNGHPDFGGPGWIPDPDKRTVAHAEDLVQPSEQANLQTLLDIANGKYLY
jgi:hypothetical protein